ncbi:cache and HAMP domain-containing protein, partial [Gammaproteobacteria bacterium]|nr:cache and HAMP domain-containing protein [Gammaproteobacteria bacterium]
MFKNLKIGTKILFVTVSMVAVVIIVSALISDISTREALEKDTFNRLTAVRAMKAQQVEDYFQQIKNQIITFSENQTIVHAMNDLSVAYDGEGNDSVDGDALIQNVDKRLGAYYRKEYLTRLMPNLDTDEIAGFTFSMRDYIPRNSKARLLQDLYIASNPNPPGQKQLLDYAGDDGEYSEMHALYHPLIRSYLEKFGYYDIFLIDNETGNIVYSVYKEVDFATSLLSGPYKDTNLAKAFIQAREATEKDFVRLVDFEPYYPSYGARASFIASPIFKGDENIGVLVFQLPVDRINDIMTNKHAWADVGLGESGETYIVGDDFTLRNQSRFLIENPDEYFEMISAAGLEQKTVQRIRNLNSSIGLQVVRTPGTEAALEGKSSTEIFPDYRGIPVLSSYSALDIPGVHWAIMSEIDRDEAFQVFDKLRDRTIMLASILLALTIYISYYFSLSLTRPLRFLQEAARSLTTGKLDDPIKQGSNDEIGGLAGNIEQMRVALR